MHCYKWLVTQPPFSLMGLERDVSHICQLPHIFHFSISVDLRADFIQLAALARILSRGPGTNPPTRLIPDYLCWTLVVGLPGPALLRLAQISFHFSSWARPTGSALRGLPSSWNHGDPGHGAVCHRRGHHPFHGSSQAVWHLGAHVLIWR